MNPVSGIRKIKIKEGTVNPVNFLKNQSKTDNPARPGPVLQLKPGLDLLDIPFELFYRFHQKFAFIFMVFRNFRADIMNKLPYFPYAVNRQVIGFINRVKGMQLQDAIIL